MSTSAVVWKPTAHLNTKPEGVLSAIDVHTQQLYVVVGFGVENQAAYKDGVHYLSVDPGHAFMYTVRNNVVTRFFSFGPLVHGDFLNAPGTPDYGMDYPTRLFKVPVTAEQMTKLEANIDVYRQQILAGKMKYRGITNDTCAETTRQILSESGIDTPNGKGPVIAEETLPITPKLSGGALPNISVQTSSFNIPPLGFGKWKTDEQKVALPYPAMQGGRLPDLSFEDTKLTSPEVNAVNPYKWYDEFKIGAKYKETRLEAMDKGEWSQLKMKGFPDPAGKLF